jgi:hypothetical protein
LRVFLDNGGLVFFIHALSCNAYLKPEIQWQSNMKRNLCQTRI